MAATGPWQGCFAGRPKNAHAVTSALDGNPKGGRHCMTPPSLTDDFEEYWDWEKERDWFRRRESNAAKLAVISAGVYVFFLEWSSSWVHNAMGIWVHDLTGMFGWFVPVMIFWSWLSAHDARIIWEHDHPGNWVAGAPGPPRQS